MTVKLEVKSLYKIFGEQPEKVFKLLEKGHDRASILKKTGQTLGVHGVDLAIHEGEIFVVMGLSGSGKSTLVRLFNRLIEPTRGQVLIDGEDIAAISDSELRQVRRKKISMVFQSFALMPHLSVLENAAFGLELAGVPLLERQESARQALNQVGLGQWVDSFPDALSGGMKQRVGLARALANDPDILLMDEAFSALDPLIRTEMQDELLKLQASHQRTIVFISHDLDEAMRIGDRIAIMQDGQVIQVGTPDEILSQPANDYVRAFFRGVDLANVFSARDIVSRKQMPLIKKHTTDGPGNALRQLKDQEREFGYVVDRSRRFLGVVSVESLGQAVKNKGSLEQALLADIQPILGDTSLNELISQVASAPCQVPVVEEDGTYLGLISKANLLNTLDRSTPV
ncbi:MULTISPECIES: glycine betaine/L-proline ABC transporter ATP-binding protein ProV [Aeromonas]|jgi:glycine betaine/proline transport system ATP-binding protein|uniref:Quaternary amine transport ATP-binding protein n=3 Tax=Gammaproteobacteria TaxID=1236 RepID=A0A3L0VUE1_ECOLX|nr:MULTISPECIES: glycine betaine/L-proline ABC transporter ATP-binding protein ProV [Aeromonas]MBP6452009.1 glycine betaine/L-proline ABC transporter ATP-binding protein ProV [Aeromonas sp.]ARW80864.1 Glycine/betaine/L-proline transport ATP-binding protein ProV [Aeromonas salmonicida]ATP10831.1 ABC-type transport system ATP-binding protein (probable substrate glycine betaine) [Aeromonas salmonicida subsp. pectinolytica 34mel]ATU98933.1 glycine betaine/L-proline ABC transporter ATP-binding prote